MEANAQTIRDFWKKYRVCIDAGLCGTTHVCDMMNVMWSDTLANHVRFDKRSFLETRSKARPEVKRSQESNKVHSEERKSRLLWFSDANCFTP